MKSKRTNHARVVFDAKSVNENFARTLVAGFVAALDPTVAELTDIKTALSEAVTNCIVHAYPDTGGQITLDMSLWDNETLRLTVADRGCGIADVAQAMTPLFTTGDPGERSGLGFSVMESFMDKLRVTSHPGRGTRVTMTKRILSKDQTGT